MAASLALTAVAYAPLAAFRWPGQMPSAHVVESVVGLAVVCSAAAFLLFFALIAEVGPVRATVITYVNPAVAAVVGVLLLNEHLTAGMLFGFALVLLRRPVREQRQRIEADVDRDQRAEGRLAALDLLARERLGDEVEPGAAVLLGDGDPEDAELGHALDRAHVEVVRDVVLDRVREDPVLDEPPDRVLEQALLVAELEIHVRSLA